MFKYHLFKVYVFLALLFNFALAAGEYTVEFIEFPPFIDQGTSVGIDLYESILTEVLEAIPEVNASLSFVPPMRVRVNVLKNTNHILYSALIPPIKDPDFLYSDSIHRIEVGFFQLTNG